MRNNNNNILNIKHISILKFPNINYYLSNAPYHEIIDTAIIREKTTTDKDKDIKFERILKLIKQLLFGTQIATTLINPEKNHKIIPEINKENDIIEELIITESQIELEIKMIKDEKENESRNTINQLLNDIPKIIKNTKDNDTKDIEYKNIRDIQNKYREIVSKKFFIFSKFISFTSILLVNVCSLRCNIH